MSLARPLGQVHGQLNQTLANTSWGTDVKLPLQFWRHSVKPYEDRKHYKGEKTERCLGCREPCTYSPWGRWCYTCNVQRMKGIDDALAPVAKALGVKL